MSSDVKNVMIIGFLTAEYSGAYKRLENARAKLEVARRDACLFVSQAAATAPCWRTKTHS